MSSQYVRQLPASALPVTFKQADNQVTDFGAFRVLEVYFKIFKAGPSQGSLFLSHNATMDPDNWKAIAGASIAQNGTDSFVTVNDFLRYVRVEGTAGDGTGVGMVDIVAKE